MATQSPHGSSKPERRLDRRMLGAAAALGVLVILALVFALTRGGADPGPVGGGDGTAQVTSSVGDSASTSPSSTASPTSTDAVPSSDASSSSGATPSSSATSDTAGGAPTPTTFPGGGTPRPTDPPVSLTAPATAVTGVTARVLGIEKVQGISNLPGEIAGPSLRVTVEYANGTSSPLDLRGAVVNLYAGQALTPAIPLTQPGAKAFPSTVAAGGRAQGIFVFNVPTNQRDLVRIEVDLSNQGQAVLFQGPVR